LPAANRPFSYLIAQDYEWATENGLTVLVNFLNEATGSKSWNAVRQWGEDQDEGAEYLRDAVVLYDTTVYEGTDLEKTAVGPFRDTQDLLAGMQPSIKNVLSAFTGRWAGVQLKVPGTDLSFVLISFHGRKIVRVDGDVIPVQTNVKAAMAKDFVAYISEYGAQVGVPALVAGSWNTDDAPVRKPLYI
jgi:hypothetical protein